ncbi:MAG: hypothetical protein QOH21_1692 [Acidobacteriota bacterium]|jgi:hypothetical protein|nr:hypothetical protein [Acidobacteriota bacterium]
MNQLAEKVKSVAQELAAEKGPLNLFALLEREGLANRWDLVISAPWAKKDDGTFQYVADTLKRHLAPSDMTLLARIVVLQADAESVLAITDNYNVEQGHVDLPPRLGLPVTHGYIITSRRAA